MINKLLLSIMLISKSNSDIVSYEFVETAPNTYELPKNFRLHDSSILLNGTEKKITIAVSAQFSQNQFRKVFDTFADRKIEVINMRKEPNLLIKGSAISPTDAFLDALDGITSEELAAYLQQQQYIQVQVGIKKIVEIIDGITFKRYVPESIKPFDVYTAVVEDQFIKDQGLKYTKIPLRNHHLEELFTTPALIDDVVASLTSAFAESDFVYLHCEGGKSRSASVAVMGIMMLEGKNKSFEELQTYFACYERESKKIENNESFFRTFHRYIVESGPEIESYSEFVLRNDIVIEIKADPSDMEIG